MSSLGSFSNSLTRGSTRRSGKLPYGRPSASGMGIVPILALIVLGLGLSAVMAYLVVVGYWEFAVGLLLVIPTFIALRKYPFLAVMIWLILTPLLVIAPNATMRTMYWTIHRVLPPAMLIIIMFSHAMQVNKRSLPRLGWIELVMVGYVVAGFLSIVTLNDDPQATAFLFYDRVVSPMCLYLIIRLSAPSEQDLKRLLPILFFLALSQSIIGLLSWSAPQVVPPQWLDKESLRTVGSLVNTATYSTALIFAGLLLLHAALTRKPGLVRTLYLIAFTLALLCDFLSLSRASWLAGVLVIMGLIALYPKFMLRFGLVTVPVFLILAEGMLSPPVSMMNERLSSAESERSALSRLPVFYAAFRMFEDKPVFGWGYGNFDRYDRRFQGRVANFQSDNKDHASHNFYFTLIAEQGLTGFFLYLTPLIWGLILTLKALRRMPPDGFWSRKLLFILWLIILNYLVVTSFSNMRIVFGLGVWWIAVGLIVHIAQANAHLPASSPRELSSQVAEQGLARPRLSAQANSQAQSDLRSPS